ncbi:helix-turn-helix transcriptional regulator [Pseudomonadota bacterium]
MAQSWPIRWDLLLRYRLIEVVAYWEGRLTTNHLCHAFGIGRQQASKDINSYNNDIAPGNLEYDKHLKGYKPTLNFSPTVTSGSSDEYLHLLHRHNDLNQSFDSLNLKQANTEVLAATTRNIRPEILRPLVLAARQQRRVEIDYFSITSSEYDTRVIAPHTLVHNGIRWHVRAYCEKNGDFRDFVLSRFRDIPDVMDGSPNPIEQDKGWNTQVTIRIKPNPELNSVQKRIVAEDWGMKRGTLEIRVRGVLVQYVIHQLRLDLKSPGAPSSSEQIVLVNAIQLKRWLFS